MLQGTLLLQITVGHSNRVRFRTWPRPVSPLSPHGAPLCTPHASRDNVRATPPTREAPLTHPNAQLGCDVFPKDGGGFSVHVPFNFDAPATDRNSGEVNKPSLFLVAYTCLRVAMHDR